MDPACLPSQVSLGGGEGGGAAPTDCFLRCSAGRGVPHGDGDAGRCGPGCGRAWRACEASAPSWQPPQPATLQQQPN